MKKQLQYFVFTILILVLGNACGGVPGIGGGGGGGGSSDNDPVDINMRIEPKRLDSGDILTVEIRITEVKEPFVLKIRHNESLAYVPDSMVLYGDGNPGPNIPTPTDFAGEDDLRYLVIPFYTPEHFGTRKRGTLTFNFQGVVKDDARVSYDADEFNLVTPEYFDSDAPRFSSYGEQHVRIDED
jgi:hypothetical protein